MTEKYVNRASVCYSLTSSGGCHSFMPRRAPKGKHGQQGHVLSRTVFVTAAGLPASVYMANTMEPAGAEGTESGNRVVVKVWFILCSATDPHGQRASSPTAAWENPERRRLDVTVANQNACVVLASQTISGDGMATSNTVKIKVASEKTTVTNKNLKTGNTECVCECDLSFKQITALKWTYTFITRWHCANPWSPWTVTTTSFIS